MGDGAARLAHRGRGCVSVVPWGPAVKDKGGRIVNGYRNVWFCGLHGLLWLLALLLGLAFPLQLLQLSHGIPEGMLQADALRGDAIQQGQLFFEWQGCLIYAALAFGQPRQQPLGDGHLFQMEPFGPGFGLPLSFEIGPELPIFRRVFAGEDDVTGTQAVGDGVEAHAVLPDPEGTPVFGPVECKTFCRLAFCCLSEIVGNQL